MASKRGRRNGRWNALTENVVYYIKSEMHGFGADYETRAAVVAAFEQIMSLEIFATLNLKGQLVGKNGESVKLRNAINMHCKKPSPVRYPASLLLVTQLFTKRKQVQTAAEGRELLIRLEAYEDSTAKNAGARRQAVVEFIDGLENQGRKRRKH